MEKLKQKLRKIINANHTVQVFLVLKNGNDLILKLADVEDDTEPEIRNLFADSLRKSIIDNEDLSICDLSKADDRGKGLFFYDYIETPEELDVIKNFDINNYNQTDFFDFATESLEALFGYLIYFGSMNEGVVLFKKHYSFSLIKRESFLLGIKKSKNRFEKINTDEILRLNGDYQIVKIDGNMYIKDIRVLENNLGFDKLLYQEAEKAIENIKEIEILENVEELSKSIAEKTFAKKLSKIKKELPIFDKSIPVSAIIAFSKTYPGLAGKFRYNQEESKICLDTKKSKDFFLKLLNDSFLYSELTKEYYEARAKDNINAS